MVARLLAGQGDEGRGYPLGDHYGTLLWVETDTDSTSTCGRDCALLEEALQILNVKEIPAQI